MSVTRRFSVPWQKPPAELVGAWHRLQAADRRLDSPFLHPSFAAAVARRRPATRVGVVQQDDRVVALLPYEQRRGRSGRALALGLSDVQAVLAEPDHDVDLPPLLDACGLRLLRFDHLVGHQGALLARAPGDAVPVISPALDLSNGAAAWEKARRAASSLPATVARKGRKLARELGPVQLELHSRDHRALDALLGWKSEQYRRTGRRDRFADAATRGLVHDLLDVDEPGFRGALSLLTVDGRLVAGHFGLRTDRTLAWWFPTYDTELARYSPGQVLLLEIARAAAADGITCLDLGRGDEPYKTAFADLELPLLEGHVASGPWPSRAYTAGSWPLRTAEEIVLGNPVLRRSARRALRGLGAVRTTARAGAASRP